MPSPLFVVDAFTDRAFAGNPAAVCPSDGPPDESRMRLVAREMNLSETAFVWPEGDGWRLRWFTPESEVRLCGHATLATAHVLWQSGTLDAQTPAVFRTLSGTLVARRAEAEIELDFPEEPLQPVPAPPGLLEALGVREAEAVFIGWTGTRFVVEVTRASVVREARPSMEALRAVGSGRVAITARSDDPAYDIVSRYFAPGIGVPEDPVTGSAHCALGPYWAEKLGRAELRGWQASARGGTIRLVTGGGRVRLFGQAVTVMRGELLV